MFVYFYPAEAIHKSKKNWEDTQNIYENYTLSSKKAIHTTKFRKTEIIHTTCSSKSKMKITDPANKFINT